MVDADVPRRRLDALLQSLDRLQPFVGCDRQEFVETPSRHDLAERYLHLAVKACLDLANHVIADRCYEAPDNYRQAFAILSERQALEAGLAHRMQGWAGFRNVLVHGYADIDHGLSYDAIQEDLDDLRRFAATAAAWLPSE